MMRLRKRLVQFLADYPPAINPDELVWSHAKRAGTTHRLLQGGEVLRERSDRMRNWMPHGPAQS